MCRILRTVFNKWQIGHSYMTTRFHFWGEGNKNEKFRSKLQKRKLPRQHLIKKEITPLGTWFSWWGENILVSTKATTIDCYVHDKFLSFSFSLSLFLSLSFSLSLSLTLYSSIYLSSSASLFLFSLSALFSYSRKNYKFVNIHKFFFLFKSKHYCQFVKSGYFWCFWIFGRFPK